MSERTRGIWFAVLTGLLWAILAIKLKLALDFASAGTIVWFRFVFAFFCLGLYLYIKSPQDLKILRKPPLKGIFAGLFLAFNYYGFMKAVEYTTPSNAQIMIQSGPLLVIVMGVFYFNERMRKIQIGGFTIAGLGFIFFYRDQWNGVHNANFAMGAFWVLTAALAWAIYAIMQKQLLNQYRPQSLNWLIYGLSLIVLSPLVTWSEFSQLSWPTWILLASLGLNTVLAYGFLAEAFQRIPASLTSLIIAVNPLLTVMIMSVLTYLNVSWMIHEKIHSLGLVGALCVVLGVILAARK
jgi:drug/metabolite transporter (DMT)-like permease